MTKSSNPAGLVMGPGPYRVLGSRARPDVGWVARVSGRQTEEVVAVMKDLKSHSEIIRELLKRIMKTGKAYYAQFPAPLDLYALVRLAEPGTVAESGVASGISSAFILLALTDNGRGVLHSIDYPVSQGGRHGNEPWAVPSGMSSGWAIPRSLRTGWDLRTGRSEDLLKPLLEDIGRLDFYCHDSPVDARHFAFEMSTIRPWLRGGSWWSLTTPSGRPSRRRPPGLARSRVAGRAPASARLGFLRRTATLTDA